MISPNFISGQTLNNPPLSGNFTSNPLAFEVVISRPQSPLLSSLYLSNSINVTNRAVSLININNGGEACALALGKTSTGTNDPSAITANGNAKINLTGCGVFTNSSDSQAIYYGPKGSASINLYPVNGLLDASVGATGGASFSAASTINECTSANCATKVALSTTTGQAELPDPYANLTIPSPGTCLPPPSGSQCTNKSLWCLTGGGNNYTLNPGTYCGGISMSANAVTLNSGVYVLAATSSSAGLTVTNGTSVTGNGVTLVFTSEDGTYPEPAKKGGLDMMDLAGGTSVTLTPPTTGSTAGIAILGDRSMPLGTSGASASSPAGTQFVIENGAALNVNGVVYLPNGALSLVGDGAGTANPCVQIIANVIDMSNSGTFTSNCSANTPSTLIGAIPRLVE